MNLWRVRPVSIAVLLVVALSATARAASVGRDLEEVWLDLGGTWRIAYDAADVGLRDNWHKQPPTDLHPIRVPSCFEETRQGAGYDGVVWYFHRFTIPEDFRDKALYLEFGAVNYACRAWLNGVAIGRHEGGYHRFRLSLGAVARIGQSNQLVVRVVDPGRKPVDGLTLRAIPHGKESWYFNFGGVYGPVRLLGKPAVSIEDIFVIANADSGNVTVQMEIEKKDEVKGDTLLRVEIFKIRPKEEAAKAEALHRLEACATHEQKAFLELGTNRVTVELKVEAPRLWSLDDPFLYRLTATAGTFSRKSVGFGFRSFTIENGEFRLNGKRIFIKAVLYQPYYPATLGYPASAEFVRREVAMIKTAGFNLVRFHAAAAPPGFLQEADKTGLMVLEEPSLGWVYGPVEKITDPCLAEVAAMVRRDRNHPSVVAWGTISQSGGDLAQIADQLARHALELDPTRPVFGNWPALWVEASERACFVYLPGRDGALAIAGGQIFPSAPLSDEDYNDLSALGTSSSLVFVSALGSGGVTNLPTCLDGFGGRDYLEDYELLKGSRENAAKDFSEYRLSEFVDDLGSLCRVCQDAQAAAAVEMIEALRSNPDVDGYCYSQWRDAAWESGPGVVDVWGNPKQPHRAFNRLNQPVYITLRLIPSSTGLDRPVRVLAAIINDGALSGRCSVEFALRRADGRDLRVLKVTVELDEIRTVTLLEPIALRVDGPTGLCRLSAGLFDPSGKKVAENERRFLYVSSEQWDLSEYDLLAIAPGPRRRSILASSGVRLLAPPALPRSRTVLVSARGPAWTSLQRFEPLAESLEWINREGGTLLLDCSGGLDPAVERVLLLRAETTRALGGFIGKFLLARFSRRIGWFPTHPVMTGEYRSVIPRFALVPEQHDWRAEIALVDGYGRFGGFAWAEKRWGAGRVVPFTLPILDIVDRDPTARLMFYSFLKYYSEHPRIAGPGDLDRRLFMDRFEGKGETLDNDR